MVISVNIPERPELFNVNSWDSDGGKDVRECVPKEIWITKFMFLCLVASVVHVKCISPTQN